MQQRRQTRTHGNVEGNRRCCHLVNFAPRNGDAELADRLIYRRTFFGIKGDICVQEQTEVSRMHASPVCKYNMQTLQSVQSFALCQGFDRGFQYHRERFECIEKC